MPQKCPKCLKGSRGNLPDGTQSNPLRKEPQRGQRGHKSARKRLKRLIRKPVMNLPNPSRKGNKGASKGQDSAVENETFMRHMGQQG